MNGRRIEWIDVYKAIGIILVVLGHTTGQFNNFIYQFHMAAFFVISGYCTNLEKEKVSHYIYKKVYSLYIPLFFLTVVGALITAVMNHLSIYGYFFSADYPYVGFSNIIKNFIMNGSEYVWVLGATWFILVLFMASILQKILFVLCGENNSIYYLVSGLIFIMGYICVKTGKLSWAMLDLVLVAQGYFAFGQILRLRQLPNKLIEKKWLFQLTVAISFIYLWFARYMHNVTVDWPSRQFGNIFVNLISSIAGCILLWAVSIGICNTKIISNIKKILTIIGRNTYGIVALHFLAFKLIFCVLALMDIIPQSDALNITPSTELQSYWYLIVPLSIAISMFLWFVLHRIKIIAICLGQKKQYEQWWERYLAFIHYSKFANNIKELLIAFHKRVISRKKKIQVNIANKLIRRKKIVILWSCYFIICFFPVLFQGVTLNDELRYRLYRMQGFGELVKQLVNGELRMGRPLRIMAAINEALNFLTTNDIVNKAIQIGIMILTIIIFGMLISKLINKTLACVTMALIALFLPITIEHAVPNAFIGLCCLPIMCLCISLINWLVFLEYNKKSYLILSLIFWLFSLLGYEYMVTYTPVYIILYIAKKKDKTWRDFYRKCILPCLFGALYIAGTFLLQKISTSVYGGSSLGFVSIESSWNIIKTLVLSAIPGYFLLNSKYQYLIYLFTGEKYTELISLITDPFLFKRDISVQKMFFEFIKEYVLTPRNVVLFICMSILFYVLFRKTNFVSLKMSNGKVGSILYWITILGYIFIPLVPNSLAQLYQGAVSSTFFTSLPVSCGIFFTVCLLIGSILCEIIKLVKGNMCGILGVIFLLMIIGIPIQSQNNIIGKEQSTNFDRLLEIEALFRTDCMKNMDNSSIVSQSFFETKNLLAIHDSYWNEYAHLQDLNINVVKEGEGRFYIYYVDDEYFSIIGDEEIVVLSTEKLPDIFKLQVSEQDFKLIKSGEYYYDNGFLCYQFNSETYEPLGIENKAFSKSTRTAGNTLESANIIYGYYDDGWVGPNTKIELFSGTSGGIILDGYYPFEIQNDLKIKIYSDGKECGNFFIHDNNFTIEFNVPANEVTSIEIVSDFIYQSDQDIRELSFILKDLRSK